MIDIVHRLNQMEQFPGLFARTRDGFITHVAVILELAGHPEPGRFLTKFSTADEDELVGGWDAANIIEQAREFLEEVPAPTPEVVGEEIYQLLRSLRSPGHSVDDEKTGWGNYSTDALRAQALDYARICWFAPGELAPACACPWSPEDPSRPRLTYEEDFRRLRQHSERLGDGLRILKDWVAERAEYHSDPAVSGSRYGQASSKLAEWATAEIDAQAQELKNKNNKNS